MNEDQKQIVKLMKEWKNEVKQLAIDYTSNVQSLNTAKIAFENNTKKWWVRYEKLVYALSIMILATVLLIIIAHFLPNRVYDLGWIKISPIGSK